MPERIEIPCPGCQRDLSVREQYLGRMIQCKHCGERFVARSKHKEEPRVIPWPEVALKALGVGPDEAPGAPPPQEPKAALGHTFDPSEAAAKEAREPSAGTKSSPPVPSDAASHAIEAVERERERLASDLAATSRSLHALSIQHDEALVRHQTEVEALRRAEDAHAESVAAAVTERDSVRNELELLKFQIESQRGEQAAHHSQSLAAAAAELEGVKSELALLSSRLLATEAEGGDHGRALAGKQAELDGVRAELELLTTRFETKQSDEAEHARSLSDARAELEGTQAELARLTSHHETIRTENHEQGQRVHAEAEARIADARSASEREHRSRQDAWDAERAALTARISSLEDEATRTAERRLEDERLRSAAESEQNTIQQSIATAQNHVELERRERAAEVAALRTAIETAIVERDAAKRELEAGRAELVASEASRSELDHAAKMADERLRAEVNRLIRERDEALTRAAAIARQLENQGAEMRELRQELEETRASGQSERSQWENERTLLASASERSRTAREASGRRVLEAQDGDARLDDIADMFAAGLVADLSGVDHPPDKHKGVDHAVDDKQLRITELSSELEEARADAANLRSTLTSLGIRFY